MASRQTNVALELQGIVHKVIDDNSRVLIFQMTANNTTIVRRLQQEKVITDPEKQQFKSFVLTPDEKNDKLIEMLRTKSPEQFKKFLEVLRSDDVHMLDIAKHLEKEFKTETQRLVREIICRMSEPNVIDAAVIKELTESFRSEHVVFQLSDLDEESRDVFKHAIPNMNLNDKEKDALLVSLEE